MYLSNCFCYKKRKKDKIYKNKSIKNYKDKMKVISSLQRSSDGIPVKIYCSNILCYVYDISPLKKQAVFGEKVHYFCSQECWQNWLIAWAQ